MYQVSDIIHERVKGLDITEHKITILSRKKQERISQKIRQRTATKEEYKLWSGATRSHYPQLAGKHEVIFPVTKDEHLHDWHGGNYKNSRPGKAINHNPFRRRR